MNQDKINYYTFKSEGEYKNSATFLAEMGMSSRFIRRSIREKTALINGEFPEKPRMIFPGDIVKVKLPDEEYNADPEEGELKILYEDEDLLIIDKSPYMVTHTTLHQNTNTLSNYVAGYFLKIGLKRKVRLVNRLDRDTTGIIIIAKNSPAHGILAKQFESRSVVKKYLALCHGEFEEKEGVIDKPIGRSEDGIRREIDRDGKRALTSYRVLEEYKGFTLVELTLHTGRTHQLRVHLSSINNPIAGDELYGIEDEYNYQKLHSYYLKFTHPRSGEEVEIQTEVPEEMRRKC